MWGRRGDDRMRLREEEEEEENEMASLAVVEADMAAMVAEGRR